MNWEAIGAIGELIGAVAVVVTLLYLVKQIKQNTESTKAVGLQTWQSDSTAHWLSLATNPDLSWAAAVIARVSQGFLLLFIVIPQCWGTGHNAARPKTLRCHNHSPNGCGCMRI
jgi:heme/copper-type cytochrome/quinol oxidase subunit 1